MRLLAGDLVTVAKEWGNKPLLKQQGGSDAVVWIQSGDIGIVIYATTHGQLWTKIMARGAIGWMVTSWLTRIYNIPEEVLQNSHVTDNVSKQG